MTPSEPGPDDFLTVVEVAWILKVNQQTVRNWIFRTAFEVVPLARLMLWAVHGRTVQCSAGDTPGWNGSTASIRRVGVGG